MTTKISGDNISAIANQGVNWQAVTVADGSTQLNAVAGNGYLLDTNAGVIEVFLPSSPTRGDTVSLADYSGTFSQNNVFINTGGVLIDSTEGGPGSGNDFVLSTNNQFVELVYVDAAKGWLVKNNTSPTALSAVPGGGKYNLSPQFITATGGTVTESGDYKIHTFTGDGCFTVTRAGNITCFPGSPLAGPDTVDYLVVAGGGGGGHDVGGGGGAGGFRESHSTCVSGTYTASPLATPTGIAVSTNTYPITVGAGGTCAGSPLPAAPNASPGSNSIFSTITSTGGGGGGGFNAGLGQPGGSGGGGAGHGPIPARAGGTGNTPPTSPSQGNNGGQGPGSGTSSQGGGGGGATASGANGGESQPGFTPSAAGATTNITASPVTYSAGGRGAGDNAPSPQAGGANTGKGGDGGGTPPTGSSGGKGIVVIRYKYQ